MKKPVWLAGVATILLLGAVACETGSQPAGTQPPESAATDSILRVRQDSLNRTLPGYVVDSILPVDEELRRFRAAVGAEQIAELDAGEMSRDSLVKKFLDRLQDSDTVALERMLLSAREFAWLVYPESPYAKPPYTQAPALVWNQIQNHSRSGFVRLVRRLGGKKLRYNGYRCSERVERQGSNKIWTQCTASLAAPGEQVRDRRLFGSIIERHGHFKFVSFANEF